LRAGRRLALTSAVLAGAVYLLGWAGRQSEVFSILNVLSLLSTVTALGLRRRSWLAWAALAAMVAALSGVADLPRLNGAGILAVMCAAPAAAAAIAAWFAWCGRVAWLPRTLFPPPRRSDDPVDVRAPGPTLPRTDELRRPAPR
jgi:hypothetical protein